MKHVGRYSKTAKSNITTITSITPSPADPHVIVVTYACGHGHTLWRVNSETVASQAQVMQVNVGHITLCPFFH